MSQKHPALSAPSSSPAKAPRDPRLTGPQSTLELAATLYTREQLKETLSSLDDTPQLALAGRSNVGKSSLLNSLACRKGLAKVSSTPGKTRSVNLFRARPEGFYVTDLPGYGYAKRGKSERRAWSDLIGTYLTTTPQLKAVIVLLDCRLPPQQSDIDMVAFARASNIPVLAVLTKADKCKQHERDMRRKEWAVYLRGVPPLPVSSKSGMNMTKLWALLRSAAECEPAEAVEPAKAPADGAAAPAASSLSAEAVQRAEDSAEA